jgi:hypothetical protein
MDCIGAGAAKLNTLHIMANPMNTLMAVTLISILVLALTVATTVAKARRDAQNSQLLASAERELGQAQAGIRKHARVDPKYKPSKIGGGQ